MLKKRRLVAEDGLTATIVYTESERTTLSAADRRILDRLMVPDLDALDAFWRPHMPAAGASVTQQSFAWYAAQIRTASRRLRATQRQRDLEAVTYHALRIGFLQGTAFWRFNLGDHTRLGVKVQQKNRESARKPRPRGWSAENTEHRERIAAAARAKRALHPYSRSHSTHWLAREVTQQLSYPLKRVESVRQQLIDLRIK